MFTARDISTNQYWDKPVKGFAKAKKLAKALAETTGHFIEVIEETEDGREYIVGMWREEGDGKWRWSEV